ncbi:MAG: polyphosphate kinase 1 [Planctomyces sp.]|nr:polyphosphate kinase 1 [Planctomyces sp.]
MAANPDNSPPAVTTTTPSQATPLPAADSRFFNRELSWLEFNQRVLDEALDPAIPLLERLKFLAITASNLDEFFMVRVGSLQMLRRQQNPSRDPAGMTPAEQLEAVSARTHQMVRDQYRCLLEVIEPALQADQLRRVSPAELTDRQHKVIRQVFDQKIYPILTPIGVPAKEDFPQLVNQTLNMCVRLQGDEPGTSKFAVIPFGRGRERIITLPHDAGYSFILLENVLEQFVGSFFIGETVVECIPFRITRNADMELREDAASDLLREMVEALDARREGDCVRLELAAAASQEMLEFLMGVTEVSEQDVYLLDGPIDLTVMMRIHETQGFDAHRDKPWPPRNSPRIDATQSMFQEIAKGDILLYHPYESFDPIVRFIEEAAVDPDVLAIKQTLYRTSRNSPIVAALKRAAQNGKYVTAVLELKARFDEARNIEWARDLERADVQVIYGVKGLKTHAKICLVVRREPQGIQRYMHFGTGNYNEITSRLYVDASLFTCDEDVGSDATAFFNAVTGYSQPQRFRRLEAAPLGLRERILELIDAEIDRKKHGQKAMIHAKFNALVDEQMIEALYRASQAGVKIRLNIRGICCLRPGIEGLSENITVTSIVDRFLEHSRVLYFHHGGDDLVFISSADWMPRNLDRRIELLVPVSAPGAKSRMLSLLRTHFQDTAKAKKLLSDGRYVRTTVAQGAEPFRSQAALYARVAEEVQEAEQMRPTMLEPHLPSDVDKL